MKSKNFLIAFGVIGIGLILYKFLLGFVAPIALLVSLRYVLKFLLKNPDSAEVQEVAQVITKTETSSSKESIVEIKAIEEDQAIKRDQANEEDQAIKRDQANEEDQAIKRDQAIETDQANEEDQAVV